MRNANILNFFYEFLMSVVESFTNSCINNLICCRTNCPAKKQLCRQLPFRTMQTISPPSYPGSAGGRAPRIRENSLGTRLTISHSEVDERTGDEC